MTPKKKFKIFTIDDKKVVKTTPREKQIRDYVINVISVGEEGRGRWEENIPIDSSEEIKVVSLGETKSGRLRFFKEEETSQDEEVIVVFKPRAGYRGLMSLSGRFERKFKCREYSCNLMCDTREEMIEHLLSKHRYSFDPLKPDVLLYESSFGKDYVFKNKITSSFLSTLVPELNILAEGKIAQGAAGRMGSNQQLILILPKDVVVGWAIGGRVYGNPREYEMWWDGEKLNCMAAAERELLEVAGALNSKLS